MPRSGAPGCQSRTVGRSDPACPLYCNTPGIEGTGGVPEIVSGVVGPLVALLSSQALCLVIPVTHWLESRSNNERPGIEQASEKDDDAWNMESTIMARMPEDADE